MPTEAMYEPFAEQFANHAEDSAYNAHYDRPAVLEVLGDVQGLSVLDAGCGPGFYTRALLDRGAVVTAFDPSPAFVNLTRERTGAGADVRQLDLEHPLLGLEGDSFDRIVLALVIHHVSNRQQALSELYRVLKPGGRLILSTIHPGADWANHGGSYFNRELVQETWQQDWEVRYWRQPLGDWCREFTDAGFLIEKLVEPRPAASMADRYPDVQRKLDQAPGFIIFQLLKP